MLKRKLILALSLMAMALPLMAQPEAGTFSIIPKVGVDITNVTGDHLYEYGDMGTYSLKGKYQPGFTGGVEAMYQAMPRLAVSLGVMYAQEGSRHSDIELGQGEARVGINENNLAFNYLQVPIMAHVYVAKGLSLNAGVRLGFLHSASHEYDTVDITYDDISGTREYGESHSYDEDIKSFCKTTSISIPVGVSYEYMNVVLDARYHFPLTKTFKETSGKHQGFTVTVGYKFDL